MLTQAQITAGSSRLVAGKLTAIDVDQTASILSMDSFFGGLIDTYGYAFKSKLATFDDVANPDDKIAAQIAACLIKLEELEFGVARKEGGSSGIFYKEKDEYWQYVQIIFLKMYQLPREMAKFSLARAQNRRFSSTAYTDRAEGDLFSDRSSEAYIRRFGWRSRGL